MTPPVLEPRDYRIILNLQEALRGISRADGYFNDVAEVAVKLDPNVDVETLIRPDGLRPFVIIEVKPEERAYHPSYVTALRQPVTVHFISESVPEDDASRMREFYRARADIERAGTRDITRGQLARDTRIVTSEFDLAPDSTQVWARVDHDIYSQRTYGEPNA